MEKFKFFIAIIKNKYGNFIDSLYNKAWFYFEFGYKEAKIFLFLYAVFKFNLKLYEIEKETFSLVAEDTTRKLFSGKRIFIHVYRSKINEDIICCFRNIKYKIIFSQNRIINILLIPYFSYKNYKIKKHLKFWGTYFKNEV